MLKINHIVVMSVLGTAVALSACQPREAQPKEKAQPETTQPQPVEEKLIGDSEKLNLNLPDCSGNDCAEMTLERLSSNQPFIDQKIDEEILKQLQQILSVKPDLAAPQAASEAAASEVQPLVSAKQTLEQNTKPYLNAFLALDEEIKALSANHQISLMIKPKILNADLPLATVVLNSSSYLGGAHGSSAQQYYSFDLKAKKLVSLNDLVLPKQRAALEQHAHEAFKIWVIDSKLANDVAEYEQAWQFKLSENYYLGKQGLILQYAEYEIGPYVVGLPRLTLPYDQLNGILKPQYLPSREAAASEVKAKN